MGYVLVALAAFLSPLKGGASGGGEDVKEKDVVQLKLEGVGNKGDPYGKHKGFVIFVKEAKGAKVGETISVEITKVMDRCAFGKKI